MSDDSQCTLCPRMCQVKREKQELGFCRMPKKITVSRAALHMWEEPCISGEEGSGAVFFSGCNLQCVYCREWRGWNRNFHRKAGRNFFKSSRKTGK